jgi:hypothetical protein
MTRPVEERAGSGVPAGADASSIDVFISHVEEDGSVAIQLADALEAAGYSTWCYERDTIPGPSYLLQTSGAIAASRAVVVLISADSLGSHQVTSEVVRAHEEVKPFIPLLLGISREEFGVRQPEWREAIGSAATLELPEAGVRAIVPRIVDGLTALGVAPHEPGAPRPKLSYAAPPRRPAGAAVPGRGRLLVPGAVVLVLALIGAVVLALSLRGGGDEGQGNPSTTPPETSASSPTPSATPSQTPPAVLADAATTPVETLAGRARATARVGTEFCPIGGGACQTANPGRVFLFVDLVPWGSGSLGYDNTISMSAFSSRITFEGDGYASNENHTLGSGAGFTVVFPGLPDRVAGSDVELRWPDNPALRLHVKG